MEFDLSKWWNSAKRLVIELMEKTSVKATQDGCNLNDVFEFQLYFAEKAMAIIVYDFATFAKGSDPLYDGCELVPKKAERTDHKLYIQRHQDIFNQFQILLVLRNVIGFVH